MKRGAGGRLTSARSKTGDPQCSQAMSTWVRARHTGASVAAEIFKILGMCRAKARALKMSRDHGLAGNDAKSHVWAKRAERGLSGKERLELAGTKRGMRAASRERAATDAATAARVRGVLAGIAAETAAAKAAGRKYGAAPAAAASRSTPARDRLAATYRSRRAAGDTARLEPGSQDRREMEDMARMEWGRRKGVPTTGSMPKEPMALQERGLIRQRYLPSPSTGRKTATWVTTARGRRALATEAAAAKPAAARAQARAQARPSPREQADAHRAAKGAPGQRADRAKELREARSLNGPGVPIAPHLPIGDRLKQAPHLERKLKAILDTEQGAAPQAPVEALQTERKALSAEIREYTQGAGAGRSHLDPEHEDKLKDFSRRDNEILSRLEGARKQESDRVHAQVDHLLRLPAAVRASIAHTDGRGFQAPKKGAAEAQLKDVANRDAVEAWLGEKTAAGGAKPIAVEWRAKPKVRAYASREDSAIVVQSGESPATMAHELGHHLEYRLPGADNAALAYLAHRVGKQKLRKLNDVVPGSKYAPGEMGRDDEFAKAFGAQSAWYVGKHYNDGSTEIVSMGLEMLHKNPLHFAKNDPEYCKFILGILDGSMRKP